MTTAPTTPLNHRLAYRVDEAANVISISRSALYELIRSNQIRTFTQGRTRLVSHQALAEWVTAQEQDTTAC